MKDSATGKGDLAASLVLIFPLWLAYAVGILFSNSVNGVDFLSRHVWDACDRDRLRYLLFHASIAVAFLVWLRRTHRDRTLTARVALPVALEAGIYAVTLGPVVHVLMAHVLAPAGVLSIGATGDHVIASLGAGVHEELVFRLGLCGGGTWLLLRAGVSPRVAVPVAIVASSLLFALAHHLGPHGEPWSREAFAFRALAGVAFALIMRQRSLAHAVYAHALYDVWVLAVR